MNIRFVEIGDCRSIWSLKNEKEIREASRDSRFIPLKEHTAWFNVNFDNVNKPILIVENEVNTMMGLCRFNIGTDSAEINIGLFKSFRGKGYAKMMIRKCCNYIFYDYKFVKFITAEIKSDNIISVKSFENARFEYYYKDKDYVFMRLMR